MPNKSSWLRLLLSKHTTRSPNTTTNNKGFQIGLSCSLLSHMDKEFWCKRLVCRRTDPTIIICWRSKMIERRCSKSLEALATQTRWTNQPCKQHSMVSRELSSWPRNSSHCHPKSGKIRLSRLNIRWKVKSSTMRSFVMHQTSV